MQDKSDIELISRIKSGDILAYEILVKRYQKKLFYFANRIINNTSDAQEIVQDALYKTYQIIDRIDPKQSFSAYVYRMVKNNAISKIRTYKKSVSIDKFPDLIESDYDIYASLYNKDRQTKIKHLLQSLTANYRKVIELYFYRDLSYAEISRELKIPLNSVRTNLRRAKNLLKKELCDEAY
jgi:RNA polymerase sigma-70 factor, ECF subfamily